MDTAPPRPPGLLRALAAAHDREAALRKELEDLRRTVGDLQRERTAWVARTYRCGHCGCQALTPDAPGGA